jgi:hypothetical protein
MSYSPLRSLSPRWWSRCRDAGVGVGVGVGVGHQQAAPGYSRTYSASQLHSQRSSILGSTSRQCITRRVCLELECCCGSRRLGLAPSDRGYVCSAMSAEQGASMDSTKSRPTDTTGRTSPGKETVAGVAVRISQPHRSSGISRARASSEKTMETEIVLLTLVVLTKKGVAS